MNHKINQVLGAVLTIAALLTGQNAWAQNPAAIGSISYNSTLGAREFEFDDDFDE